VRRLLHWLALYGFQILVARPILLGLVGVRYRRRHLVPQGPCLVVSNHNSHLDAAVLLSMFPLRRLPHVHPVAAADYFGKNWFKRTVAMFCMNGIPIARRPAKGKDPLSPLIELLKAGESLVFFPEGSRGEAGVVAPFRKGIGILVREVPGLLVVPVFLSGPERIWPRGNVLPVPLSIDAHIGKPRAYPTDDDPKEIAARVREDVLSLAPPPPPLPGRRTAPTIRVGVCSIDPESRAAVFRSITERLSGLERTLGVSEPVLEADAEGLREATGPIAAGRNRLLLRVLSWVIRTSERYRGERFVEMVERAQIDEALNNARDTSFVVVDGSAVVDLLSSYAAELGPEEFGESRINRMLQYLGASKQIPPGRWWWFLRRAPEAWLMHTLELVRPPVPDILVYLTLPIPRLMERLRSGGLALQPYENAASLERLQNAYRQVAEVLRKRRRVEVLEIDARSVDPQEVAARVEAICQRMIKEAETGS
jgi:1-acyl-sn-glycerol-3-phosphate acyltransferase